MTAPLLVGRYHILSPLGAGGMGEVFLAEDTRLERRVAVTLLPTSAEGDRTILLLVPATGGEMDEYGSLKDKTVNPVMTQAIVTWLTKALSAVR